METVNRGIMATNSAKENTLVRFEFGKGVVAEIPFKGATVCDIFYWKYHECNVIIDQAGTVYTEKKNTITVASERKFEVVDYAKQISCYKDKLLISESKSLWVIMGFNKGLFSELFELDVLLEMEEGDTFRQAEFISETELIVLTTYGCVALCSEIGLVLSQYTIPPSSPRLYAFCMAISPPPAPYTIAISLSPLKSDWSPLTSPSLAFLTLPVVACGSSQVPSFSVHNLSSQSPSLYSLTFLFSANASSHLLLSAQPFSASPGVTLWVADRAGRSQSLVTTIGHAEGIFGVQHAGDARDQAVWVAGKEGRVGRVVWGGST